MIWIEVENTTSKQIAKWRRTTGISDDGVVFIPAGIDGLDEQQVHMCTLYDSTPSITYLNHYYVPADWLGKEFPDSLEYCEMLEAWTREYCSQNKSDLQKKSNVQ